MSEHIYTNTPRHPLNLEEQGATCSPDVFSAKECEMDRGTSSKSPLYSSPFPEWGEFVPAPIHLSRFALAVFGSTVLLYGLFQKKLLPKGVARMASSYLFWPTLPITFANRLGNFFTPVDGTLELGVAPLGFLGHPKQLYGRGVRGVVNMCTEYSGPESYYADLGITQLRLPTVDHYEPTVDYMKDAVEFIESFAKKGEKCMVHCKAGHGRGASIALCWVMYSNPDLSAEECNKLIYSKRKVRPTLYKQPNIKQFKQWIDTEKKKKVSTK